MVEINREMKVGSGEHPVWELHPQLLLSGELWRKYCQEDFRNA